MERIEGIERTAVDAATIASNGPQKSADVPECRATNANTAWPCHGAQWEDTEIRRNTVRVITIISCYCLLGIAAQLDTPHDSRSWKRVSRLRAAFHIVSPSPHIWNTTAQASRCQDEELPDLRGPAVPIRRRDPSFA